MRLSHEKKSDFFSKSYKITSEALVKATQGGQKGEVPILKPIVYQSELKKLQDILSEICNDVFSDSDLSVSILVLYVRSSLLHYDGRIDLYLEEGWGNNEINRNDNIANEAVINSMLWHPAESTSEWAHLLERVIQLNKPVIIEAGDQLSGLVKNGWLHLDISNSFKKFLELSEVIQDLKPNIALQLSLENIETMILLLREAITNADAHIAGGVLFPEDISPESTTLTRKMLVNPIRILAKFNLPYLVYLPLITVTTKDSQKPNNPFDGGTVLSLKPSEGLTSAQFEQIDLVADDLREALRECILFPLLCAEDRWSEDRENHQRDKELYFDKFFSTTTHHRIPLIDDLIDVSKDDNIEKSTIRYKIAFQIGKCLQDLARKKVRGIDTISHELYVGINELWDELNIVIPAPGNNHSEGIETGSTMRDSGKSLINLLGKLLDFEEQLKYIPRYRDHFIHSIHVLAMGAALVGKLPCFKEWRENESFWRAWFITSLFHDIGIPIAKAPEALEQLIKDDLQLLNQQRVFTEISWHYLLLEETFHRMLQQDEIDKLMRAHPNPIESRRAGKHSQFSFLQQKIDKKQLPHLVLSHSLSESIAGIPKDGKFHNFDHGVLSGLLLHKQAERIIYRDEWKNAIHAAVLPSMLHHSWEKEKECPFQLNGREGFLLYLLILCDSICQTGRTFQHIKDNESGPSIRFKDMTFLDKATVRLDYSDWKSKEQLGIMMDYWDKFVTTPMKFCNNFGEGASKISAFTVNFFLSDEQWNKIHNDSVLKKKSNDMLTSVEWNCKKIR